MIKREIYLERIRPFYEQNTLIKIIYGLRRSGKSVILEQIQEEIKAKNENKIYINFESLEYDYIKTAKDLDKYIKSITNKNEQYYIFLDEVGMIADFEKGINSLRIEKNYSIFITGSNSKMLFSELSTVLSGRYVSFEVKSLSFKEVIEHTKSADYKKLLLDILEYGTLPERFSFTNQKAITNYLEDVYNSIILKDIISDLKIRDLNSFNKILQYLLETEGKEFSPTNILNYLKSNNQEMSKETLYNYTEALVRTFILNKVPKYDITGKRVLTNLPKYYVSDIGLKKIKTTNKKVNYSNNLESLVYNELRIKGYEVYIGKTTKGEVDFIAIKDNTPIYIQVTYMLAEQSAIDREFGAFDTIKDNYPKYVISMDELDMSQNGIKHLNIVDFLMRNEL